MIGLEIPWTRRALCAIQAVAIEPPRWGALKRLDTAFSYERLGGSSLSSFVNFPG